MSANLQADDVTESAENVRDTQRDIVTSANDRKRRDIEGTKGQTAGQSRDIRDMKGHWALPLKGQDTVPPYRGTDVPSSAGIEAISKTGAWAAALTEPLSCGHNPAHAPAVVSAQGLWSRGRCRACLDQSSDRSQR